MSPLPGIRVHRSDSARTRASAVSQPVLYVPEFLLYYLLAERRSSKVVRTSSSEVMGFESKHGPGQVRTRDLSVAQQSVLVGGACKKNGE